MADSRELPDGLLVAWYGDDYTGAAAVMEVMTFAGLPSVLFLDVPTPEQLARFDHVRGIGIAGSARSRSPAWMDEELPPIFAFLAGLDAPLFHYKVCSTFDSAPSVGSIGRAAELAFTATGAPWAALFPAAPAIGRYQAFGNLFASAGEHVHRLDRHPVMANHPVTPMDEADVCRHLSAQTALPLGLIPLDAPATFSRNSRASASAADRSASSG
ncbi:MAG: four-carbon acid sugar kinase family protein, partial [Pseudomonadota bacterium]